LRCSAVDAREFHVVMLDASKYQLILGHTLAQLVEALYYKPEGRGFDWNFSLTSSSQSHYGPGVDSASNRNENQKYVFYSGGGVKSGQCVRTTALPTPCASSLEIWEPQSFGTLRL
jgi:hypothetical protein